jgi:DNA topoisomerase-3
MDAETFETALEKLWIHGGVRIDPEENVVRGEQGWQMPYQAQSDHKLAQLAQMTRFAEAHGCRMLHLVRHFGDQEDSGEPCGGCDVCAPRACLVRRFRPPVEREKELMRATLQVLRRREGQSTGQVHRAVCGDGPPDRRTFERLLSGLTRAGLLRVEEDAFEKNGRTIHFQRAYLTAEGRRAGLGALAGVLLGAEPEVEKVPDSGTKRRASGDSSRRARTATVPAISTQQPSSELVAALKSWRLAEARRHKVPAFTILSDRTLMAVAAAQPAKESSLLAVHGIGPKLAEKHGAEILAIVAEARLRDQAQ